MKLKPGNQTGTIKVLR